MSGIISTEDLNNLKSFINLCKAKPEILNFPDLSFFKQFIESFGGKIPQVSPTAPKDFPSQKPTEPKETEKNVPEEKEESESEPESELEFDLEGCVDPDEIQPEQKMGDEDKIPTEEECDQADEKRAEAMEQFSNGNFEKSIELYTEAIELNPSSALFYSKRGQAYLKLMKPKACIKDCDRALELNPDSAAAYKFRGRAYRLIAEWEKAAKDLRQACKIDFDEQTDEWLREVTPNAQKIEQHNMKRERKRAEKELKQKQERVRKAREANAKASASTNPTASTEPSGPGGPNLSDFYNFVDPEIIEAFKDPDVAAAFEDISANPANFIKYQSNPKISAVINKLAEKIKGSNLGGMGGFPGMGGMGGFPGAGSGPGGFPGAGSGPGGFPGAGSGPGGFPGAGTNPGPAGDDVGLD